MIDRASQQKGQRNEEKEGQTQGREEVLTMGGVTSQPKYFDANYFIQQENQPMGQYKNHEFAMPQRGWVGKSIVGIFYLIVASMFTTGCAAAYVVGMIAMGYFGVDEFHAFAGQIHHYRNQALLVACGSASAPVFWNGVKVLAGIFFDRLSDAAATKAADKITK